MKYKYIDNTNAGWIDVGDPSLPDTIFAWYSTENFNIKKISFICHSPNYCNQENFAIANTNDYHNPQHFITKPEEILELTENFNQKYDIPAIGIPSKQMNCTIIIGYEP